MKAIEREKTNEKRSRGRPVSFDRENLIMEVTNLFWEHGYNNLSFNEIAQETGLTRASLYNAFKSKEALFLEAMKYYFVHSPDAALDQIREGDAVGTAFYHMFDQACKMRAADKKHRGCLAVNSINELIASDTDLGDLLAQMYDGRRKLFKKLIKQAVDQKELPEDTDSETLANTMLAFVSGFNVFSKIGLSEKKLKVMCHTFLYKIGFDFSGG